MIDAGFGAGWLVLHIIHHRSLHGYPFVGDVEAGDEAGRTLHVISHGAKGEIRSYIIVDGEDMLRERFPRPYAWPEMDAAVARLTGCRGVVRHPATSSARGE